MGLPKRHRVVLETLLPDGVHPDLVKGLEGCAFDDFYEDFSRSGNIKLRLSFRVALLVATWVAPLLMARVGPLSLYDRETRERALRKVFSSRLYLFRQTGLALKFVLSLCYGADAEVRRTLGFWQPGTEMVDGDVP